MGVWTQIKACGGEVSCWDPESGKPLFDVTPEQAAAIRRAQATARASRGRLQAAVRQQAAGQQEGVPSDALQQVLIHMKACNDMVKTLAAEGPVSTEKL